VRLANGNRRLRTASYIYISEFNSCLRNIEPFPSESEHPCRVLALPVSIHLCSTAVRHTLLTFIEYVMRKIDSSSAPMSTSGRSALLRAHETHHVHAEALYKATTLDTDLMPISPPFPAPIHRRQKNENCERKESQVPRSILSILNPHPDTRPLTQCAQQSTPWPSCRRKQRGPEKRVSNWYQPCVFVVGGPVELVGVERWCINTMGEATKAADEYDRYEGKDGDTR
jgi:hypothetical protein